MNIKPAHRYLLSAISNAALLFFCCSFAVASEREKPGDSTGWEFSGFLGYSESNSPLSGSEHQSFIYPYFNASYSGENVFFDLYNTILGYSFINKPAYSISAILSPLQEGIFFIESKYDHKESLGSRNFSASGGVELFLSDDWGDFLFHAMYDVTQVHNGYLFRAFYALPSWDKEYWRLDSRIGLSHRSQKLVNYYYGVRDNEATSSLPAFTTTSANVLFLELEFNYQVTEFWQFKTVIIYNELSDGISDSPLVGNSSLYAFFIGLGHEW